MAQGEINKLIVNKSYSNSSSKSLRRPRNSDYRKRQAMKEFYDREEKLSQSF